MWYVIQTLKGQEYKTIDGIRRYVAKTDEEVFCIENEKMHRHQGQWDLDRTNLFPGYLFAEVPDPEDFDRRLHGKYRSLKLIRTGDEITPILPREEALLRALGGEEHIIRYSEGFRQGDQVIIESGALKGFQGEILRLNRHNRQAMIRISLFGQDTVATLGLGIVKVV